jgi:D-alanyl-D-alanine carboxypeptidase
LRYPEDKTAVTGIKYEPWHFRYVGLPHSAIMQQKNMVLEEYLDFLKKQKSFTTTVDGEAYTISYYPVSHRTTIPKPAGRQYDISGDNMDGVIVTVKM